MKKLVFENEKLIEKFDINYYLKNKNYPVASALSALETTNEIQKSYFKNDLGPLDTSDNVLRLYALLQGLFVSIDSLYALAYSLTKSKSFININLNQNLRELKYIRNDVVGHPANRVLESDTLAYCILDNASIKPSEFSYFVYSQDEVSKKIVDINKVTKAYYVECNNYLNEIYKLADSQNNQSNLEKIAIKCFDDYQTKGDYLIDLEDLRKEYINQYPDSNSAQHRVLWRIDIIKELINFKHNDQDVLDLVEYAIGLELIKILELLSNYQYKMSLNRRTPYLLSNFYRFLNKNDDIVKYCEKILDIKNPLFKSSITYLLEYANKKKVQGPIRYLKLLWDLYNKGEDSLVYALALPLKEYKKKRK